MSSRFEYTLADGRQATVVFTDRSDGDFRIDGDPGALRETRRALIDLPWAAVHQVHGSNVVNAEAAAATDPPLDADAITTSEAGQAISVQVADCGPVALLADEGVAVVHAGWRGIESGVIGAAASRLRTEAGTVRGAIVGPCVHAECYEFGTVDLERLATRFGPEVRSATASGSPALDVPAMLSLALDELDIAMLASVDTCTACHPERHWSHRARTDTERQAVVAWIQP